MYNGHVFIWNHMTQALVKSFEVSPDQPVRSAKFVARKQWIVAGSDDMQIRVYNYNTLEKVKVFEAHSDYIRYAKAGVFTAGSGAGHAPKVRRQEHRPRLSSCDAVLHKLGCPIRFAKSVMLPGLDAFYGKAAARRRAWPSGTGRRIE